VEVCDRFSRLPDHRPWEADKSAADWRQQCCIQHAEHEFSVLCH
jgi:hypothetical protein